MSLTRPEPAALDRGLRLTACALSVAFLLLFLFIALRRLHYPFELDRIESGMMTSVWRLAHGGALYAPPSMQWVPFLYAPLFFYLSAALAHLTGLGYSTLRLVSILATLGSCLTIYALVYRETRRAAAALVAVGLFACLYNVCLGWYDVGRVDSLSVFLFLLALFATRWANPVLAAVVWLLAFHTKQTFLPFGLLAFLPLYRTPRRLLVGLGSFAVLAWLSVHLLNHATGGWYSQYAFGTTRQLAFIPRAALLFLPLDIFGPLPVVCALILIAILVAPPSLRSTRTAFYGFITVLLLGAIGFVRGHDGANINAVIPAYAWLAVLAGLAVDRLLRWLGSPAAALSPRNLALASASIWLALCTQLVAHVYQPARWVPAKSTLAFRYALVDAVMRTPGDVWLVNHSWDGILAGKPVHPEMDALDAVLGRHYPPTVAAFNQLIQTRHFAAILTDRLASTYHPRGIFTSPLFQHAYGLRAAAPGSDEPGAIDQPQLSYLPCDDLGQPNLPLLPHDAVVDVTLCPASPVPAP